MSKKLARSPLVLPAINEEFFAQLIQHQPFEMFKLPMIRDWVTLQRLQGVSVEDMEVEGEIDSGAIKNVLEYNREMIRNIDKHLHTLSRPKLLLNALMSIYYIFQNRSTLEVLCIGPRTESEIFMLLSEGFQPNNITGLDIMSYSDFIDTGDMHKMPYRRNRFDIIFLGWVITYGDIQKVADECIRVGRKGAYVAIGVESPKVVDTSEQYGVTLNDNPDIIRSTDELVEIFGDKVHAVPFRHEVHRKLKDTVDMVMVIIELK